MSWNDKFKQLSVTLSTWSKDPSTKAGALLVDADNNVRSIGYNGFPRNILDSVERLNNRDIKYKLTVHAEQNVICSCARSGISAKGCTLVSTHFPCVACCVSIIQAGIIHVVTLQPSQDFLSRWSESIQLARELFAEAGVQVTILDVDASENF